MEDDQKFLSCRAFNQLIEGSSVEDQWKITVHCKFCSKEESFNIEILSRQASCTSLHWEQRHSSQAWQGHHFEVHRPVEPRLPGHRLDQGGKLLLVGNMYFKNKHLAFPRKQKGAFCSLLVAITTN